ncbi:hypothetical protein [Corynebacterium sp. sy039]|uniref:hypothetical protein n=1 Tax=Corynebacterium sp. sy039 TaxID=2599641 RepID=UPI0011B68480|nr:hypothetical protein [Corynebacterium sp. sy039]QDZ42466.1 hypothetical protein FQV43_04280 [Corynebacterium sp. sy039]
MIILIAEILFWVFIALGMTARYLFRLPALSRFLLCMVPMVDVFLIIVVIRDLRLGAPVGLAHQLAGLYLGVSLVLGPGIIRWCDAKIRSLSGGYSSDAGSKTFRQQMLAELKFLAKWSLAMGIAYLINQLLVFLAVNETQKEALAEAASMPLSSIIFVVIFGPGWLILFGKSSRDREKKN